MDTDDLAFIKATLAVYGVFLWGHVGFISCCDRFGWCRRYKIQGGHDNMSRQDDRGMLVKSAFMQVVPSHVVSVGAFVYFFRPSALGMPTTAATAPTWAAGAWTMLLWHVLFDTWFYWTHRALHHRRLYKYIHKQHHQFREPTSVAAFFAHPIEDLFVNTISTFIGPVLFPAHGFVFLVYLALRFHETTDAHSGYDFPWSPWRLLGGLHGGARRHDWHHSHVNGNYGGFTFWDWACGTDKEWRAWEVRRLQKVERRRNNNNKA